MGPAAAREYSRGTRIPKRSWMTTAAVAPDDGPPQGVGLGAAVLVDGAVGPDVLEALLLLAAEAGVALEAGVGHAPDADVVPDGEV